MTSSENKPETQELLIDNETVKFGRNFNERYGCDECDMDADWIALDRDLDYAYCFAHFEKLARLLRGDLTALALVDWHLMIVWECPNCHKSNSERKDPAMTESGSVTCSACKSNFALI